jgi:hypothetical protein
VVAAFPYHQVVVQGREPCDGAVDVDRVAPEAIAAASKPPIIQRQTARFPGKLRRSKKSFQLSGAFIGNAATLYAMTKE